MIGAIRARTGAPISCPPYSVLGRVHPVHECPQAEETPWEQQLKCSKIISAHLGANVIEDGTLSQMKMRFQKPIIESWAGVMPLHECEFLVATTYMTWINVSIVSSVMPNRIAYRIVARSTTSFERGN